MSLHVRKGLGNLNFYMNHINKQMFLRYNEFINSYESKKNTKPNKRKTMIKEVDSCSFRTSIFNLEDSFKIYKSKISEYSKFKSKMRSRTSYRTNNITSTYRR